MVISFKANIRTGFFKSENFLVSFNDDREELMLEDEKNNRLLSVPFQKIQSIHLSCVRSELNIITDKKIIDGFMLEMENAYEVTEMLRSTFGPLFVCD